MTANRVIRLSALGIFGAALLYGALVVVAYFAARPLLFNASPDPGELPHTIKTVRIVQVTTADGERLVAWWLPPQPGKPVILFFDGRRGGLTDRRWRFQRMATAGVGCLSPAYRGFSGSTGAPSEAGLRLDADAGYAWLRARYPQAQIAIHGVSLGSGVAADLASRRPARALILEAPFTSAVAQMARRAPLLPMRVLARDRFESDKHIGKVRMPILIVHGDRDRVIPVSEGRTLYALARRPKRLVIIAGGDHLTLVRQGLYDHIWRFLGLPLEASTAFQGRPAPAKVTTEF